MNTSAQVYGVPIGGTLVRQRWTTDGSGSTYLWGYLDSAYKRAPAASTHCCLAACLALQTCRPPREHLPAGLFYAPDLPQRVFFICFKH